MNSSKLKIIFNILAWPAILLVLYANYLIFLVVPNERLMGPVQRIFYFHVASATSCYIAIGIVFVCSLMYLGTRNYKADLIAQAAGEVALLLCTIVLISGMIWGHSAWNTWFSWEPRLVSFLVLWLTLLAFNLLRAFGDPQRLPQHSAVIGIISAINVPIVIYSIKLLPHLQQLHPEVVENRGLKDPLFQSTMFWAMGAILCLQLLLIAARARIAFLEREAQ